MTGTARHALTVYRWLLQHQQQQQQPSQPLQQLQPFVGQQRWRVTF
jgi:hypothetical protein